MTRFRVTGSRFTVGAALKAFVLWERHLAAIIKAGADSAIAA
jgi:hypothetical protein